MSRCDTCYQSYQNLPLVVRLRGDLSNALHHIRTWRNKVVGIIKSNILSSKTFHPDEASISFKLIISILTKSKSKLSYHNWNNLFTICILWHHQQPLYKCQSLTLMMCSFRNLYPKKSIVKIFLMKNTNSGWRIFLKIIPDNWRNGLIWAYQITHCKYILFSNVSRNLTFPSYQWESWHIQRKAVTL